MSPSALSPPTGSAPEGSGFDPALMAVISKRLDFILREMTTTLIRTARSTTAAVGRDFSCTLLTAEDELLAGAEGLPIHIFGGHLQARAVREQHPHLREGDAYLDNDPYVGNTHHADHTILVPVFVDGRHLFTTSAKAHLSDIGNSIPTPYHPTARDIYEEGALCFPAVQVQRDYENIDDIIRMCRRRIRVPDQWYGDYLAMVGSARIGERRLKELAAKYGAPLLREFVSAWFDYSEQRTGLAIERLRSGEYHGTGYHDPTSPEGAPIPINVRVVVDQQQGRVEVDLTDNMDCQPFGLNLTQATSAGAAISGVLNTMPEDLPINAGSLRRIRVTLRENCLVGIPRHPVSCSVATSNLACRLVNVVQRTMSAASDEFGVAEGGVAIGPGLGVIAGHDPRSGRPYVAQPYFGDNGGPASAVVDGNLTYGAPVGAGVAYRDSIELVEQRYPLLYETLRLMTDSGGAGYRRGGLGWTIEYGPRLREGLVSFPLDGYERPAEGVKGGRSGRTALAEKILSDGTVVALPSTVREMLQPGERIRGFMNGGGGYGDPFTREPARVLDDVQVGFVSIKSARDDYGVVIETDGEGRALTVDDEGTSSRRRQRGTAT